MSRVFSHINVGDDVGVMRTPMTSLLAASGSRQLGRWPRAGRLPRGSAVVRQAGRALGPVTHAHLSHSDSPMNIHRYANYGVACGVAA